MFVKADVINVDSVEPSSLEHKTFILCIEIYKGVSLLHTHAFRPHPKANYQGEF